MDKIELSSVAKGSLEELTSDKGASSTELEKLLKKLLGEIKEQSLVEKNEDLENLPIDNYDFSFDEVDENTSSFAFAKGMDLRVYAQNIENELQEIERDHESDYVNQTRNFVELHNQVQSCDEILAKMEDMLSVFQMDLGNISSEIETLQEQSLTMNIKFKNRTAVEKQLSQVLDEVIISPSMIKKITEGDVDDAWLAYLIELNKKMIYIKTNQDKNIKAIKDVGPELEKLRLKATEKIREFLLTKIKSLRIPNTNVQMMQQSVLLKYKKLYQFVMDRYGEVAFEIRQTYVNTMKWYFFNHFDRYNQGLQRLQNPIADKYDMIGYDESSKKGGLFGTSKIALQDKVNIFALGDRIKTLYDQDAGVILVHIAENNNQKYTFEAIFRSFNLTLIDNASSEYFFDVEFLSKDDDPALEVARDCFAEIFDSTIKLGLATLKQYVDSSFDALGILLCIRLNTQFAEELQRRRVPALESYTNQIRMLLWPRFQAIMDMHVESVKKARSKFVTKDAHPHYITRRYGEFAASILTLNEEYSDPILINSLSRLRSEVTLMLNKMSGGFDDRKSRLIFLINNYDLIITFLAEIGGKAVDSEIAHFKELLNSKVGGFVEEELEPYFGGLIAFVKMAQEAKDINELDPEMFERVSADFSATWRQSITSINSSVIQNFSNFKNGTAVLHAVLGQLIIYYTNFHNCLEMRMKDGTLRVRQQPVGVQAVMVEIKRFRSNF
ncbi:hypothetical protein G9A89_023491 [Geosiphon pyriformis]|nr:hypothetical protein G9A89_023491 [Geosiphon pyriformis]